SRFAGCWAGVVLNGRAPVNVPGGEVLTEGLDNVPFGGSDADDSSGLLRYVRIEFGGGFGLLDSGLLTLNAVGRGTVIDHVHVNRGLGDGVALFGGNAKMKYLSATAMADDGLDWQIGYTGALQYGFVAHDGTNMDLDGSNSLEGENNEASENLEPRSNPRF